MACHLWAYNTVWPAVRCHKVTDYVFLQEYTVRCPGLFQSKTIFLLRTDTAGWLLQTLKETCFFIKETLSFRAHLKPSIFFVNVFIIYFFTNYEVKM